MKHGTHKNKFRNPLCDDKMTFQDCELAILRHAVDENETLREMGVANSEEIKAILKIVEKFILEKKLICYGGTAINNILPKYAQFYNRDKEIPDYDFFSANALSDAKELADIYYKEGYQDVEAKSGVHTGTYKVYVNFIPIADITSIHSQIFKSLSKDAIVIAGIRYCPPNYLRMSMFLELSRPMGDVTRWEKVMKRLTLLNKYYPLKSGSNCDAVDFQRKMEHNVEKTEDLYVLVRDSFIDQGVVFFGGYATSMYSKYMTKKQAHIVRKIPDFDVLAEDPENCAFILKDALERNGFSQVKIIKHNSIDDIIPEHVEIVVGTETMAFVYKPIACHSYNTIHMNDKEIHIATIDTILSFYLAFLYANFHNYNADRLLCMASFLFDVEQKNRLEQHGLLKRFHSKCYGKQVTLEEVRSEKAKKYKELKQNPGKEYEKWFLKYAPGEVSGKKESEIKQSHTEEKQAEEKETPQKEPSLFSFLRSSPQEKIKKTLKQRLREIRKTRKER
jgi:Poly(A) polymerase catalytic subunit